MAGWPLWRLGKNIHKRGRFPDMKRWRVVTSGAVLTAAVLFVCLVPVPVSRVRGVALVQPQPDAMDHVFVRQPGILKALYARPGAEVRKGEKLAEFINRDLDAELASAVTDREVANKEVVSLERQMQELNNDPTESGKLVIEIGKAKTRQQTAIGKVQGYENLKADLTLLSPRDGVVGQGPKVEDVGRFFEKDPNQTSPLFTIIEPGRLRVCLPVVTPEFNLLKEDMERPSAKAHASYQLLRKRVTVNYQGAPLPDVLRDLEGQVKGLKLALDPGLTNEQTVVTYKAEKERAGVVLDQVLGNRLGYVVVSEKGAERDGLVEVRPGHARGLPEGPRKLNELDVTIRVHGRGAHTWKGRVVVLPESDAKTIPLALSSRANGPVAVKAASGSSPNAPLVPQAQHYLLYVDIIDPDGAITPGSLAQVKIYCQPETCLRWLWRKANDAFDLGLI
jgi:hypothetical protein